MKRGIEQKTEDIKRQRSSIAENSAESSLFSQINTASSTNSTFWASILQRFSYAMNWAFSAPEQPPVPPQNSAATSSDLEKHPVALAAKRHFPTENVLPEEEQKNKEPALASNETAKALSTEDILLLTQKYEREYLESPPFQALLNRLEQEKERPLSFEVSKVLKKEDILTMFNYFLNRTDADLATHKHLVEIANLKPRQTYRLDKNITKLPRTMNVICDKNGNLKVIVETKSKLANGEKILKKKKTQRNGVIKSGKPSWQLDNGEVELFNAVVKLDSDEKARNEHIQELKNEVSISQTFNSDFINVCEMSSVYQDKNNQFKVSIYSEKAFDDLFYFFELPDGKSFLNSSSESKVNQDKFILNLLEAVKLFHDKGLAHQDLKPENILVMPFYKLVNGELTIDYYIKLTDLAFVSPENDSNPAKATYRYQSPEMDFYHADPNAPYHAYFRKHSQDYYGHLVRKIVKPFKRSNKELFERPHKANDMWALGIIVFMIRNKGKEPKYPDHFHIIETDPLLKGLLSPRRETRIDIDKAIALHKERSGISESIASSLHKSRI